MNKKYYIATSLFRLYLAFHIFKKYLLYFFQKELLYGNKTFIHLNNDLLLSFLNIDISTLREFSGLLLSLTLLFSLFFGMGIGRNWSCLILFILVEIIQRINGVILNGGDNYLKFILLYMCFVDSYGYFTLFKSKTRVNKKHGTLTYLGLLSIKIHLCVIYFVSAIYKINAKVWFTGVANYYIFNLERFMGTSLNFILSKNSYFVTLSTYLTLFWELSFSYLIWLRKTKIFILVMGVFIHLGIYVFMMIHDFEILFIAVYILFFTDSELLKTYHYFNKKGRQITCMNKTI